MGAAKQTRTGSSRALYDKRQFGIGKERES